MLWPLADASSSGSDDIFPINSNQTGEKVADADKSNLGKSIVQSPESAIAEKLPTKGKVVAKNHNAIYQGKGDSYILAKLNVKAKIAFVQVKKGEDGSFYSIGSGLVSREDYLKNKPLLWERAQTNQLKESPSAVTGQSNDQVKSIAQSPENAIPTNLPRK